MRSKLYLVALVITSIGVSAVSDAEPGRPTTTRVSVRSDGSDGGIQPLGSSGPQDVSHDGRYVAFASSARLVPDDTNRGLDVFVRDRLNKTTERVSVDSFGRQSKGIYDYYYTSPSISADGRFVAFGSDADDLVESDDNDAVDVFVHDRELRTTERISLSSAGAQASGESLQPSISGDGHLVAFMSLADDLVVGDTNEHYDIFIRDRVADVTTRVSVSSLGTQANADSFQPKISDDGTKVAFVSNASNLAPGDNRYSYDVFLRDLGSSTTQLVSGSHEPFSCGSALHPDLSADGRYVSHRCDGSIVVFDRESDLRETISVPNQGSWANGSSWGSSISADGRYVAFSSEASNLVTDDFNRARDFFVRDRQRKRTYLVSVASDGNQQITYDGIVFTSFTVPVISGDGRLVAFESDAPNLVDNDRNGATDVFAWEMPDPCDSGSIEAGPVSRRLHGLQSGDLGDDIRDINCDLVVEEDL